MINADPGDPPTVFAHANFLTLDVFAGWLPAPYVPMALICWIIANVTSALLPFELSPGFFRIGYVFPAHAVYEVLVDIWSRGCNPQLQSALPVMFAWEAASLALSAVGVYRRAHLATLAEEAQQREFEERLDEAVEFQIRRDGETREEAARAEAGKEESGVAGAAIIRGNKRVKKLCRPVGDGADEVREELAQVISNANERERKDRRRASQAVNFGLSFTLPFGGDAVPDES